MESSFREKIWPQHTYRWFKASTEALVPHNFDSHNTAAMQAIRHYLQSAGISVPPDWYPNEDFHENMKRWLGACSAPQQTLLGITPTQPFYLSFFPFAFEIGTALLSATPSRFITQPGFLTNGKTFVIKDDQPQIVELHLNGIMDRLFGQNDPKFSFVYLVLVNDNGQSNIADMGFEETGNFWLKMRIGFTVDVVERLNNKYAAMTSDRAAQIQSLRIYLASADSYIQLDIENREGDTYLVFRQKVLSESFTSAQSSISREKQQVSAQPGQLVTSSNSGAVVYGGTNVNIQTGIGNTQNVTFGSSYKD